MRIMMNILLFVLSLFSVLQSPTLAKRRSYIVYLGTSGQLDPVKTADSYHELLDSCMKSKNKTKEAIFYTYSKHINGFAAILEDEEAAEISKRPEVVSVFVNQVNKLHTTRSWEFLGLEKNGEITDDSAWAKGRFGEDVIIGALDTGVWPESESFNDKGMGAVPTKWKGYCDTKDGVLCNGTAKGGSPNGRIASYKVCWAGCDDADVLAGFEAAIEDGVDVISVSLGLGLAVDYLSNSISIGSFHAVRNGILVVCSAGNFGEISNLSPWILTVGASTIDRHFSSHVTLGNNKQFKGVSYLTNNYATTKFYPLIDSVYAKAADAGDFAAEVCSNGSLDPEKVKGKIVYDYEGEERGTRVIEKSWVVGNAGGVGLILVDRLNTSLPTPMAHFIPTSYVSVEDGDSILSYISTTKSPVAYISGCPQLMLRFSSAGPNIITPEILKPDITAPGVSIIAAYTEAHGPSALQFDSRRVPFNIMSGTSMACPHVSGIAGLLKTMHPQWSPAAIRSAIMTTARTRNTMRQPIANATLAKASPFNYGAGHIWPNRAMDPGLVYDLTTKDYLNFLCSIGYNETQLSKFVREPYKCPSTTTSSLNDFNYPSITVPNLSGKTTVSRILKNVGSAGIYRVRIKAPDGILVEVEPKTLEFKEMNEEKEFKLTLEEKGGGRGGGEYVFGGIVWSDGKHNVRSPIVVKVAKKK